MKYLFYLNQQIENLFKSTDRILIHLHQLTNKILSYINLLIKYSFFLKIYS